MDDILKDLFQREQEANRPNCRENPRYQTLDSLLDQQYQHIIKALGDRFLDELLSLQAEQQTIETMAAFRHGFRLAVRLMTA